MTPTEFFRSLHEKSLEDGITTRLIFRHIIILIEHLYRTDYECIKEILKTADYKTLPFDHIECILRMTCRMRDIEPVWEESYRRAYDATVERGGNVKEMFYGYGSPLT